MSIEKALADVTEALNRNSDLIEKLLSSAGKGAATGSTTKKDEGEESAKAGKGRGRPAGAKASTTKKPSGRAISDKKMQDTAKKFLDVDSDEIYDERREVIAAIVDHFGAEKFSAIEKDDRQSALDLLELAEKDSFDCDDVQGMIDSLGGGSDEEEEEAPKARRRSNDDL
ncbi:hypothetical protein Q669_29685 [Labrenzia sp. C1B10]|uniref:hypothetical protein n=1 Tax=unclassified Labrenzia TaxID=2648686 RepID=UPI0003B89ACC|nr:MULTISPECIES: hypothetical protein [unclassified Labrenzia]ERP95743.1 hypothetical protein Q669_29685 [Labrenzia sp. C1B10]ERS05809.1 hypothetical protein Q675_29250 [Labrenzia sp. C1B70]